MCSARIALGTFAAIILSAAIGYGEIPVYKAEPSEEFFRGWLLCGPFPNPPDANGLQNTKNLPGFYTDYLQVHGGETGLKVKEGQEESFEGGKATWISHKAEDDIINLDAALSREDNVLGYAYCEIQSSEKCIRTLALGSNDGVRVWLNGEPVLDHPGPRGVKKDENLIPVALKSGRNTLLLKVEEGGNQWGFCCRLLRFEPEAFVRETGLFRVVTNAEGVPEFRVGWPESATPALIERIDFNVVTSCDPRREIWEGKWSGRSKQNLPVPIDRYGEYELQVKAEFVEGITLEQSIPFTAGPRTEYVLFDNGSSAYSIVLAPDASESEQWAAKELQHWLKEVSGAELPIVNDPAKFTPQSILLGFNAQTQSLLGGDAKAPALLDESFTYKNIGPTVLIWGGKQRGTQYGVMTFLEREMGCRWYTPRVTVAPEKKTYKFYYLERSEAPGIRVRNDFYFEAFEPIWAARNKINGAMSHREQPGGVECYWSVHTFYPLMPPSEFYDEHPEYYSLINGKRIHEHAQLCLTNPDVLRIMTERVIQTIRNNPQYLIYSVSQNDWRNPCECDNCQAIAEREESESGPVLWFVNQIAEAIEREFPDKFIGTLAYQYTRKPCKTIKPRYNVVIRLCSIECCFSHDFQSCPENKSFLEDINGWAAIAPHLYIWDYVVNFSHYVMPYPNFNVLQSNIKTFRDHHAIGIMEQAAYQSRGGEFAELRAYVIAKLLWDPECNVPEVIDDFMYGYYGRSGQYIKAYFDLLHDQVTPETHIHLGLKPDDILFSESFIREASAIFDRAEIVAENEEMLQRVEMTRLPLLYLHCKRTPEEAVRDGSYDRFCTIAERENVKHYAEAGEPHRKQFHGEMETYRQK